MKIGTKSLAQNSGILAITNASVKILTFLMTPIYTRILSPTDYGITDTILNFSALLVAAFSLCIDWGMTAYFYDRRDEEYYVSITTSGTWFCIISALACLLSGALSPLISKLLFQTSQYWLAVFLGFGYASIKLVYFSFRVSSRMRGQLKSIAFYSFIELIVLFVANILFIVVFRWGYKSILYANLLSQAACGLMYLWGNKSYVKPSAYNKSLLRKLLRYSIPLTPTVLFTWFNSFSDRYFIGFFKGQAQVGLYGRAYQFVTIIGIFTSAFLAAYPSFAISNAADNSMRSKYSAVFDTLAILLSGAVAFVALFAKEIFYVMTAAEYREAYAAVGLLCFGHAFYMLGTVAGYGLTIKKQSKLFLLVNFVTVICNAVFNLILVPKLGYMGSAITNVIAQLTFFIVSTILAERCFPCHYSAVKAIAVFLLCLTATYVFRSTAVLIKIVIYLLIAGGILLAYRNRIHGMRQIVVGLLKKRRQTD